MSKSLKHATATAASLIAAVLGLSSAATAQPAPGPGAPGPQCYKASEVQNMRATPDGKAIYVNAGINRVYRLDMAQPCPEANAIQARIAQRTDRSWVCRPLDVNIKIVRPGLSVSQCNVSRITRLSQAESGALPRNQRP